MINQPCPDCGTLMNDCYDPNDSNEEQCWHCPHCGESWTPSEIQLLYDQMAEWEPNSEDTDELE